MASGYDTFTNKIRLISLKFSNIGSYHSDTEHIIDFSDEYQTISIFGENNSGKTSLINCLVFALYERTPQVSFAMRRLAINNKSDKFHCCLTFIVSNQKYILYRSGKTNPYISTKRLEIYKENSDELDHVEDLVNPTINHLFGSYELSLLTNFHIMSSDLYLSKMKPKDRNQLIEIVCGHCDDCILETLADQVNDMLVRIDDFCIELKSKNGGVYIIVNNSYNKERSIETSSNYVIKMIDMLLGVVLNMNKNSYFMDAIFIDNNINSMDIKIIKDLVEALLRYVNTVVIVSPRESINGICNINYTVSDNKITQEYSPHLLELMKKHQEYEDRQKARALEPVQAAVAVAVAE
jgi:hypothetical protein